MCLREEIIDMVTEALWDNCFFVDNDDLTDEIIREELDSIRNEMIGDWDIDVYEDRYLLVEAIKEFDASKETMIKIISDCDFANEFVVDYLYSEIVERFIEQYHAEYGE